MSQVESIGLAMPVQVPNTQARTVSEPAVALPGAESLKRRKQRQEKLAKRIELIQKQKYPAHIIRFVPETSERRQQQTAYFARLRELKCSANLTVAEQQFAFGFITVLQKANVALLNQLLESSGLTLGELAISVDAVNQVLGALCITVRVELSLAHEGVKMVDAEPFAVSLSVHHPQSAVVRISGRELNVCNQAATEIADVLNDIYVMC